MMLTYDTVKKIMKKNNIWPYAYSIEEHKPLSEVALCLDKSLKGFRFYIVERNSIQREWYFKTEQEACEMFLAKIALDYPQLKKYVDL